MTCHWEGKSCGVSGGRCKPSDTVCAAEDLRRYGGTVIQKADSMNTKVWLGLVAVLALYLCVSIGWRWHIDVAKHRAWKRDWSRGPRGASVILPEIERLRKSGLAGALVGSRHTPAHRWLLASARGVIARLAYFTRTRAHVANGITHEAEDHTA